MPGGTAFFSGTVRQWQPWHGFIGVQGQSACSIFSPSFTGKFCRLRSWRLRGGGGGKVAGWVAVCFLLHGSPLLSAWAVMNRSERSIGRETCSGHKTAAKLCLLSDCRSLFFAWPLLCFPFLSQRVKLYVSSCIPLQYSACFYVTEVLHNTCNATNREGCFQGGQPSQPSPPTTPTHIPRCITAQTAVKGKWRDRVGNGSFFPYSFF